MLPAPSRLLIFPMPLLLAASLVSCDQKARNEAIKAKSDLYEKEAKIEDLELEIKQLKAKADAGASKIESPIHEAVLEDLQKVQEENEDLKEKADELRKENEKLRREANAKIRGKAIGEEMAELQTRNGKTYRKVKIKSIDDYGVSILHEAGTTTLRHDTAPTVWVSRFSLIAEPQFKEPEESMTAAADEMPQETEPPAITPRPEADTASAKEQESAGEEIIRSKFGGILMIEGEKSKGTGFLAIADGQVFLYTAAHVLSSDRNFRITNSSGDRLGGLGTCQIAADCDLARIVVNAKPELALKIAPQGSAQVSKKIRAVGNNGGAGVLSILKGSIEGVGPTELEVTASVIQGSSGGPVLSAETGEVIGVVARGEAGRDDIWSSGTQFADVRRFASRLDRGIRWKTVTLESLQAEEQKLSTFNSRTRLMFALATLEPGQSGMRLDMRMAGGKGPTILAIFSQHRDIPAVRKLLDMNRTLDAKQLRTSEKDLLKLFVGYYSNLIAHFASDTAKFDPANFSFPNKKPAEQSKKWRQEASSLLRATANAMINAR